MNDTTRRTLLALSLVLNIFLALAFLYDYFYNSSKLALAAIAIYLVFNVVSLVLLAFLHEDRVVRYVEVARPTPTVQAPPPGPAPAPLPAVRRVVLPPAPVPAPAGPFTYKGYTLYSRDVDLKNGGHRTIYFFSKHTPRSGHAVAKPAGFHVGVNERTGLPFLKKGAGADGEDLTPEIEAAYRPQCSALTDEGHQCRNSAREGSKYCASHFGYQPPAIAKAAAAREDTLPRVRDAPDTKPSVRRKPNAA
jgi:hypothetical protein